MRRWLAVAVAVAVAAAVAASACSGSSSGSADALVFRDAPIDVSFMDAPADAAPIYDFSCEGMAPLATSTQAAINIGGITVRFETDGVPLAGGGSGAGFITLPSAPVLLAASASAPPATADNAVASTVSGASAVFAFAPQSTGAGRAALDDYLQYTTTGADNATDRGTLVIPEAPYTVDTVGGSVDPTLQPVIVMSNLAYFTLVAVLTGGFVTPTPTLGAILVRVQDCSGTRIIEDRVGDLEVTATQGGAAVGSVLDASSLGTAGAGTFIIVNVPVGATTVNGKYGTHTLRSHIVPSVGRYTTTTELVPGL